MLRLLNSLINRFHDFQMTYEKVSMRGDLVAERVRVGLGVIDSLEVNSGVQLISLASLDEEHLRLAGQRRAAFGVEVSPGNKITLHLVQSIVHNLSKPNS
jgi:hypothetical protein